MNCDHRRTASSLSSTVRLLATFAVVCSACPAADQRIESEDTLQIDRSVLDDAVFQVRPQQRLLTVAQDLLSDGDYTAAFDILLELFQQPYDSSRQVPVEGTVHGTRSIALQAISAMPVFARRAWSRSCEVPGTTALNSALRTGSRVALARVAAEFPCSSVAADALITDTILALNTGQSASAQLTLRQLEKLQPTGVLRKTQLVAIARLRAAVDHASARHDPGRLPPRSVRVPSLEPSPVWTSNENPWRHAQLTAALPRRGVGSQFDHREGWQPPLVHGNAVFVRTPAGIARLDRLTGAQHWFLPFRSVAVPSRSNEKPGDEIFDITSDPRQRLERSGNVIFFVDGYPHVRSAFPRGGQSSAAVHHGATHLVAVRAEQRPFLLWQVGSDHEPELPPRDRTLSTTDDFAYTFEISSDAAPSARRGMISGTPAAASQRLRGHRFLSAPRVYGGRLFITTHHDGMTWLNCLSAAHGNLLWQQPLTWLELDKDDQRRNSAIVGATTDEAVVCLFADGLIAGCNPIDGRIEWMQSVLFYDDPAGETPDFWLEAVHDSGRIFEAGVGSEFGGLWMMQTPAGIVCARRGSRGICCLDSKTGEVRWSALRAVQGGMADQQQDQACVGVIDSQLIMMGYAHCRAISVVDGSQTWVRPLGNHDGRVCCDHRSVYVALNNGRLLTIDGHDGTVVHSQQLEFVRSGPGLVTDHVGILQSSAWSISSWQWSDEESPLSRPDTDEALAALVAQRLRQHVPHTLHPAPPAVHSVDESMTVATTSDLSSAQQLKFALAAPDLPNHQSVLQRQLRTAPDELVELLPGWNLPLSTATAMLGFSDPTADRRSDLDDLVLHPSLMGSLASQFERVRELISDRLYSHAELMLLNLRVDHASPHAAVRDQLLHAVRAPALAPGMVRVTPVGPVSAKFQVTPTSTEGFRLSEIAKDYQRFRMRTPDAAVPYWSEAMFITDVGASPHVGLVDIERGIKTSWTSPDQIRFPHNVSYQDRWTSPGLVAVSRKRQIGVISLLNDSPLAPLWLHQLKDEADGEVIALTSRQLIVSSNAGIESLHPLTGELLWTRDWTHSRQRQHLEGQYFKVYCSHDHIFLLSSLGTGCVVLRADDGAIVREDSRRNGQFSRVIDEYLVTKTAEGQLELTHLVTGRQIPVDLEADAIVAIHPGGRIGHARALLVTSAPELILLNLTSGEVETRIAVRHDLESTTETLLRPRVIHRSGLIYIALSVRDFRSPYVPESVFGEAVTGKGVLICIDPESGEELWQHSRHAVVVPSVFGDPCPFLVLWSTRYAGRRSQLRFRHGRQGISLEITVLNAFTGETVAATSHRLAARPLQVIHDAEQQQLQITTDHSTIRMNYSE